MSDFLGVDQSEVHQQRWENRRKRYAGSIGQLKDSYLPPQTTDAAGMPRRDEQHFGISVVGRYFRQSIHLQTFTTDVKQQIDELDDHRPYFTYWATFVQTVIFVVSVAVYGIAPFGFGVHYDSKTGECTITTLEHCDLLRGFFHPEAYLCAQVNCFEQICGMIPFAVEKRPDQFYRLWTSLFLHGGLFHLAVTIVFQMLIMRDMEKLTGAIRMAIIYIGSGIAGNLASCTFLPYQVEFGVLACLLVEVLQSYQMYKRPHIAILKLVGPICALFVLGLLPWFDNWAHLFGFFWGFLLAFSVMPYVSFGTFDRHRKIVTIVIALGAAIGLFIILVIIFYVAPLTEVAESADSTHAGVTWFVVIRGLMLLLVEASENDDGGEKNEEAFDDNADEQFQCGGHAVHPRGITVVK
nr:hypothetical protein BaRGS_029710 [Batillaria attramentaria]